MDKRWTILQKGTPQLRKMIAEKYNISEYTAQILLNKDIDDLDRYMNDLPLHSPWGMKDMDKAVKIVADSITRKHKIRICGDMDVDGITATTICMLGIASLGGIVDYDIPHRVKDGYGMNERMVTQAHEDGIQTIITVDNGIAANAAVSLAKEYGMNVVVTDHHEVPFEETEGERHYILPEADAIVDPQRIDDGYAYPGICGAMVAYKLMQAVHETLRVDFSNIKNKLQELATLGTICDIMELQNENRTMVKSGLSLLKNSEFVGIQKLCEATGIQMEKLSVYHVGFIIGPCLNATGRLDTAKKGVEFLLEENEKEAQEKALLLKELNDERKQITEESQKEAEKMIAANGLDKVIVLYVPQVDPAVAGIVAGRIKEEYHHPVYILGNNPVAEGELKGSGRSIEGYDMFTEASVFKSLTKSFGGHKMAAGITIRKENLDEFRDGLNRNCTLNESDFIDKVKVDVEIPLYELSEQLIEEMEVLEPYGNGNPKPVIAKRNVSIRGANIIGQNKNVLKLRLEAGAGMLMDGLYFGDITSFQEYIVNKYGQENWDKMTHGFDNPVRLTISYEPQINEWNGRRSIQVIIKDYK